MMMRNEKVKVFLLVGSILLTFFIITALSTIIIPKQIAWNQFKRTYTVKDTAKLEGNIAMGAQRILRGEEAFGVLQKFDPQIKKPAEGKEFLLVSLTIKNFAKRKQNIYPVVISVKVKDLPTQKDRFYDPIDIRLPINDEFQRLDTAVLFQPGEVRHGTFCFEIQKSNRVEYFFIERPIYGRLWIDKPIDLNSNLVLLYFFTEYLLIIFMIIIFSFQRKRRSNGKKEIFYSLLVGSLLYVISVFYHWYAGFGIWFCSVFVLLLILFLTVLCFKRRGVLLDYYFISMKDRLKLIDDFEEKMGWSKTTKMEIRRCIEVYNPNNQDSYKFYPRASSVYVNHPTEDTIKAKKVLQDLYCATKFDWMSFLWAILILNAMFIYFILTNFSNIFRL